MTLLNPLRKENHSRALFLVCLFFVSSFSQIHAQKAFLLQEFLEQEGENNSELLKSLVFNNITTINLKDSTPQIIGEGFPQKVSTDINSFSILKSENNIFRTVKLIAINLDAETTKSAIWLNLKELKSFSNLAYVLINSDIPLTSEEVDIMVTGFEESDVILLYQINSNF